MPYLRRFGPGITVAAVFAFCAGRLFLMVHRYAVNILFGDQWQFDDATLFQEHSWLEIFRWQYGPHRQGLGGVLSKLLDPLVRWNSRYEAFAVVAIICLACLAALWLKRRLFGRLEYVDIIIPLLFLTAVQYETFLGAVNPSHGPLPLLLAVLYCLSWTFTSRWKYPGVLAFNVLLIYTGFGFFIGLLTPPLLALEVYRNRSRWPLIALATALLSLASFFIGYRNDPAVQCFSAGFGNPVHYFLFSAFMLSSFVQIYPVGALIPAIILGSLLLLVLLITTAGFAVNVARKQKLPTLVVFILLSYSLLFSFATAYGRVCLGLAAAQGPRYMTYVVLAFFGLYLVASSKTIHIEHRTGVGIMLVLALLSSAPTSKLERKMSETSEQRRDWKRCYLTTHNLEACDVQGYTIFLKPEPPEMQGKLDFLERNHLNLFADNDGDKPE